MSSITAWIGRHKKRLAFGMGCSMIMVTGAYGGSLWKTRSDKVPLFERKRLLLDKPSWELNCSTDEVGCKWEDLEENVALNHSFNSIRVKGLTKFKEEYKLSPETEKLLESIPWEVRSGKDISPVFPAAWSTPHGKIAIERKFAERQSSAMSLIAHEMSHVILRHPSEIKTWWNITFTVLAVAVVSIVLAPCGPLSVSTPLVWSITLGVISFYISGMFLLIYKHRRRNEYEADVIGMLLLAYSGFDPELMIHTLEYAQSGETTSGGIFSTHPTSKERISKLNEFLPLALSVYARQSNEGRRMKEPQSAKEDGHGQKDTKEEEETTTKGTESDSSSSSDNEL